MEIREDGFVAIILGMVLVIILVANLAVWSRTGDIARDLSTQGYELHRVEVSAPGQASRWTVVEQ